MLRTMRRARALLAIATLVLTGCATEVRFVPVAEGVYAHVGDLGPRTRDNEGLNANLGLVVTDAGAVLIDSGATARNARRIHDAIRRITHQPVRWVINTGTQDHRWFGNGYFQSIGAELIAHANGLSDMRSRGGDQLSQLRSLNIASVDDTRLVMPTRLISDPDARMQLGDVMFEFRHRGGAHTPGDMMVWLPQRQVLFAGDVVYVDRLPAILPVSNTRRWLESLEVVEALAPARIVPGHGAVTDLTTARAHTRAYLEALRKHMKHNVERGADIGDAIRSFDGRGFMHLLSAADLMPGNASRMYLELERE
jgi:glyoxylase-like metal-dependent hydrolase (beta-lactamase superfamily II)